MTQWGKSQHTWGSSNSVFVLRKQSPSAPLSYSRGRRTVQWNRGGQYPAFLPKWNTEQPRRYHLNPSGGGSGAHRVLEGQGGDPIFCQPFFCFLPLFSKLWGQRTHTINFRVLSPLYLFVLIIWPASPHLLNFFTLTFHTSSKFQPQDLCSCCFLYLNCSVPDLSYLAPCPSGRNSDHLCRGFLVFFSLQLYWGVTGKYKWCVFKVNKSIFWCTYLYSVK